MAKRRIPPTFSMVMAIMAFIVAAVPASGIVMTDDIVGRVITAVVWVLVGLAWLSQLIQANKPTP